MTDSCSIRNYRPDDQDAVMELRGRAFEQHDPARERRRWQWQFEQNPWRDPEVPTGLVLEQGGRVVGYFGLIPWRVCIDGREVRAVAGTDFCVEPALQDRALGLLLARRFLALDGVEFAFATAPVPGSLPLWKYLGAETVQGSAEPCLWVCTDLQAGGDESATDVQLEEIKRFDSRFDELFEAGRGAHRVQTLRSAAYLNWRHADYPFGRSRVRAVVAESGEILGFSVLQADPAHARAYVTELSCRPSATTAARPLLQDAKSAAAASRFRELYVMHRDPELHSLLPELAFGVVEGHAMGFLCKAAGTDRVGSRWFLTGADGDLLFHVPAAT